MTWTVVGTLAVTVLKVIVYARLWSGGRIFSYHLVATRIVRWLGKLGPVGDELRIVPVVIVAHDIPLSCPLISVFNEL